MTVREILKMGDPRLLRMAEPVQAFDTPELHALLADLRDTMAAANGAGIAAPQIGVNLQVVIFGSTTVNPRYPDRELVPPTVLINPVITPLVSDEAQAWEGCLSVPGCARWCPAVLACATRALTKKARPLTAPWKAFTPWWCSTNATT